MTTGYRRGRKVHHRRPRPAPQPDLRLDEQCIRIIYPRVAVKITRLQGRQRPVRHQVEE